MYTFIILTACVQKEEKPGDFSGYYLPFDSLDSTGIEYSYRSLLDSTPVREVWHHLRTSKGLITSINYDQQQQVAQKQYERVVSNGVLIDSLILFFHDSLGRAIYYPVRVLSPVRFPFEVNDSTQVWLSKFEWWQPMDSLHIVLERRRRFMGDTTWNWHGTSIPAVRFRTEDKFETEKVGWTTANWTGVEVYAKGIGLVYYKRVFTEQMQIEFLLEERKKLSK